MMISRFGVSLNGQDFSELNENLLIHDVSYQKPEYNNTLFSPYGQEGQIVQRRKKTEARVTITFELHVYDIVERQSAYQDIISWCKNGGILRINDRPDMRLRVICEEFPSIDSILNWTNEMQITFTAYSYPYWEDEEETVATLTGSNARGSMNVPGNVGKAYATVRVTANDPVSHMSVSIGGNTITLNGISIPKNGVVEFGYNDNCLLYIRHGNTSLLNKRTGGSSDDLTAQCGSNNSIAITASANVTARFGVRGCWM